LTLGVSYDIFISVDDTFERIINTLTEVKLFFRELGLYLFKTFNFRFLQFEERKGIFVSFLYRKRGKMAKRFVHSGMAGLAALGVIIAPSVAQEFPGRSIDPWSVPSPSAILSSYTQDPNTSTIVSDKVRDKIMEYKVNEGDTLSKIAEKFDISVDTIIWQNDLPGRNAIKVGQALEILPVTGISHVVKKGDTVYSIAKKYDSSPQAVVDFPYNVFTNDETFELAIGQTVIVPDGVKPAQLPSQAVARIKQTTPNAGTVVASGNFVWPTNGVITQGFFWYHKGIDIANVSLPAVLAADSGRVVVAGWPDNAGYGNRVVIDHGNGFKTLYGHLSKVYVVSGQTVNRGSAIGQMGSTGRSTGTHLHFEVIQNGVYLNPRNVLR